MDDAASVSPELLVIPSSYKKPSRSVEKSASGHDESCAGVFLSRDSVLASVMHAKTVSHVL